MSNQCKQKISKTWLFRRLNLVIVWTKMGLWISNKKWRCWVPRARGWVSKASPRRIISCRTQKGLCRDPEPFFLLIRWRLTLSTALWSTHLMCQKKEEFHTRKKKKNRGRDDLTANHWEEGGKKGKRVWKSSWCHWNSTMQTMTESHNGRILKFYNENHQKNCNVQRFISWMYHWISEENH